MKHVMISIVVPAHNENSGITRLLRAITMAFPPEELDVVVVCNGCTDGTANSARRFGSVVRVIETDVASKVHALNLGDQVARCFPRLYIDADVVITAEAIQALARRLERGDVLAVAPTPNISVTGCSRLVRAYFGIRDCLPSSRQGIGGSGVYALSEAGRRRFGDFPKLVADDVYVRVQFQPQERETLAHVTSTVFAPRTLRQLIAIRVRASYGILELADHFPVFKQNMDDTNLRSIIALLRRPTLWPGLIVYLYVNIAAKGWARSWRWRRAGTFVWRRDDTSRVSLGTRSDRLPEGEDILQPVQAGQDRPAVR
jgi:glycosyltransferase involved in cell wall biosynthesis